jgi:hypothetical protein
LFINSAFEIGSVEVHVLFHESCHEFVVVVVAFLPLKFKVQFALCGSLDNFLGVQSFGELVRCSSRHESRWHDICGTHAFSGLCLSNISKAVLLCFFNVSSEIFRDNLRAE